MRSISKWWFAVALSVAPLLATSANHADWLRQQSTHPQELRLGIVMLDDYYAPGSSGPLVIDVERPCPSSEDCRPIWRLSGDFDLVPAYEEKIREALVASNNVAPSKIFLNSQGGNTKSALGLSWYVRNNKIDVEVEDGASCMSACVYVLSSGERRTIGKWALVGVHQQRTSTDLANEKNDHVPADFTQSEVVVRLDNDVYSVQYVNGTWINLVLRSGVSPALLVYAFTTPHTTSKNNMHLLPHICASTLGLDNQSAPALRSDMVETIARACDS